MDGSPNCMVERFDRTNANEWVAPPVNDARILTMPNVPLPLHTLAPRTIVGATEWNKMRKRCYVQAGWKCGVCGCDLEPGQAQAHEVYTYDFKIQEAKFVRLVCLCRKCHVLGIHSGRALSLYKQGDRYTTKRLLLEGADNLFRLIHEWSIEHPDQEPLRAYSTFLHYWKEPSLHDEMEEIFEKYDAKFYQVKDKWWSKAKWPKWHLTYNGVEYPTPYESRDDWEAKMKLKNVSDTRKAKEYYAREDKKLEDIWKKMGID